MVFFKLSWWGIDIRYDDFLVVVRILVVEIIVGDIYFDGRV